MRLGQIALDAVHSMERMRVEHDARMTELLETNNREVERRREAERRVAELEARLRDNRGLVFVEYDGTIRPATTRDI